MNSLLQNIDGKKTYIVAFVVIVLVILEKFLGIDIPGYDVGQDWMEHVLAALGLSALRAGVQKSGPSA